MCSARVWCHVRALSNLQNTTVINLIKWVEIRHRTGKKDNKNKKEETRNKKTIEIDLQIVFSINTNLDPTEISIYEVLSLLLLIISIFLFKKKEIILDLFLES